MSDDDFVSFSFHASWAFISSVIAAVLLIVLITINRKRDECLEYPACPDARSPVMYEGECSCVSKAVKP